MCIRDRIQYADGEKSYILAPQKLKVGDKVKSGSSADIKPGNCLLIEDIPVGTIIHNVELYPGKGAQLVRSAGMGAQLMAKENGYAQIRLPSGEAVSYTHLKDTWHLPRVFALRFLWQVHECATNMV